MGKEVGTEYGCRGGDGGKVCDFLFSVCHQTAYTCQKVELEGNAWQQTCHAKTV